MPNHTLIKFQNIRDTKFQKSQKPQDQESECLQNSQKDHKLENNRKMPPELWKEIISNLELIAQPNQVGRQKKKRKLLIQDLNPSQESTVGYTPSKGGVKSKKELRESQAIGDLRQE